MVILTFGRVSIKKGSATTQHHFVYIINNSISQNDVGIVRNLVEHRMNPNCKGVIVISNGTVEEQNNNLKNIEMLIENWSFMNF